MEWNKRGIEQPRQEISMSHRRQGHGAGCCANPERPVIPLSLAADLNGEAYQNIVQVQIEYLASSPIQAAAVHLNDDNIVVEDA